MMCVYTLYLFACLSGRKTSPPPPSSSSIDVDDHQVSLLLLLFLLPSSVLMSLSWRWSGWDGDPLSLSHLAVSSKSNRQRNEQPASIPAPMLYPLYSWNHERGSTLRERRGEKRGWMWWWMTWWLTYIQKCRCTYESRQFDDEHMEVGYDIDDINDGHQEQHAARFEWTGRKERKQQPRVLLT